MCMLMDQDELADCVLASPDFLQLDVWKLGCKPRNFQDIMSDSGGNLAQFNTIGVKWLNVDTEVWRTKITEDAWLWRNLMAQSH